MSNDSGYATLVAVSALAILAILGSSLLLSGRDGAERVLLLETENSIRSHLLDGLDVVLHALAEDSTPDADSYRDPIWQLVDRGLPGGQELELADISSAVNLNAASVAFLNTEGIRQRLSSATVPEEIHIVLAESGPISTTEQAADFLSDPDEEPLFFTVYGYWNPVIADKQSLSAMINARSSGRLDKDSITARLVAKAKHANVTWKDLRDVLGKDPHDVAALVSVEPQINVHFAHTELIQAILNKNYAGKSLPDPFGSYHVICTQRLSGEMNKHDLRTAIEREEGQDGVLDYLGTETWFWSVRILDGNRYLDAVIAKSPVILEDSADRFAVISRHFGEVTE